jgi:quercetin dioxygenase-like cupin family protein
MYDDRNSEPEPESEHGTDDFMVPGGSHIRVMLDRVESGGSIDVIEIVAEPGGGPPPHRHPYGEWFRVLEGELTMCEEQDGTIVATATLAAGDAVWIAPQIWHGTLNLSEAPTRYEVVSVPGTMTGALREAGVKLSPEPQDIPAELPSPEQVAVIAARWGIEFWTGPTELPPIDG